MAKAAMTNGTQISGANAASPAVDFNGLIKALDIDVVAMTEIVMPKGYRVDFGMIDAPGLHYNIRGDGFMRIKGGPRIPLTPHLLIVMPPNTPFSVEVDGKGAQLKPVSADCWTRNDGLLRVAVPEEIPEIVQVCGFFNASLGQSIQLFNELREPVMEQFESSDGIDIKLRETIDELLQQEVGAGAMTASLVKQVVLALLRRCLRSSRRWTEHFSVLADAEITRAFSDMVANPGADHSIQSLSSAAGLSRSSFMSRFSNVFGQSPMTMLRDLRMRQAELELTSTNLSIEAIAGSAGYRSRSSFVKAFRQAYGRDPAEYRRLARGDAG